MALGGVNLGVEAALGDHVDQESLSLLVGLSEHLSDLADLQSAKIHIRNRKKKRD